MGRKTPRAAVIDAHVLIWWLGGRLSQFGRASRAFLEHVDNGRAMVPLDTDVVMQSRALFEIPERGDRLIAATALVHGLPLITRDPEIAAPGLEAVW